MVVVPSATPVTWPLWLTVAMDGSSLVHVTSPVLTVQGHTVAVSCTIARRIGTLETSILPYDGKLVWTCPQCGNRDQSKMNVARRTCGYIGTQFWNQGRTQEIRDWVLHL